MECVESLYGNKTDLKLLWIKILEIYQASSFGKFINLKTNYEKVQTLDNIRNMNLFFS